MPQNRRMDTDLHALLVLAQAYFDAAREMNADKFAEIFDRNSSVTKVGDDGNVSVMPIATWLAAVRTAKPGTERADEILSIHHHRDLALVKLRVRVAPRTFTDLLSCLKTGGGWKIVQKVTTAR